MFYYLHLTRPPPEQADPFQPLLITPNIANDLRTEYPLPGPTGIDIFYAWVKCIDNTTDNKANRRVLGPMTAPTKLMTWLGNTYKEIQVFPPKEATKATPAGTGGRWQLLLCTRAAELGTYVPSIDLGSSTEMFETYVLPILSSPVLFVSGSRSAISRGHTSGGQRKQVLNERVFKFPSLLWDCTSVGPLRVTEHLSYDLDKVSILYVSHL